MSKTRPQVTDVIRQKLMAANVKPADLARAIDVDPSHASMILAGKRGIATKRFPAVAALLGIDLEHLLTPPAKNSPRSRSNIGEILTHPVTGSGIQLPKQAQRFRGGSHARAASESATRIRKLVAALFRASHRFDELSAKCAKYSLEFSAVTGGLAEPAGPDVPGKIPPHGNPIQARDRRPVAGRIRGDR